ncbi:hypothetical protein PFHG_04789 [Plasmodium falciparum HB3]|uniref:Plasmodium falciparum erythrocyte membrane protein 1 acidic terminal segment domain-containing protein n=4 Tax=Plasmodium falciparum TaxID=5833 RepID=A0A0L7KIR4_PLAFX|nr:hypothetical protein PFFVO_05941 [Plasmodium falciparum Vietnam Oak-Knoll (FVO)]KOB62779.1 hypothetical protein PFHG_04494 [Plasmodium falciparum HB3]KOB63831.1 hypothetical protein PFHG_04789 [Plasmodium falciparum HB3]KOB85522.1 hypothetical protein PFDG_01018 [Plasmodium falciparum Dd2]
MQNIYLHGRRRNGRLQLCSDLSSSDITSSSESEYEEIDLNDIYVSGSPKYKMFIEVVLEPLNRDTFNLSSGNTSTNKLTDNEWNQWKQDFIEQYLTHIGSAVPLYMSYKLIICICIPKLIFYMLLWMKNLLLHQYKIDFLVVVINNRNRNIDIYDEMPKRKEKELFGTKHTKNITFNRVATQTYSDPIDKWTIEHNEDLLDIPSSSHDDILKIKDETYNIISTNNLYSYENNDITPHQLGLPNIIPSGIIKHQNNGLRTNISMDIPFDEQNNNLENSNITYEDDEVQNS